jgi:hypothetical protein
MNRAMFSIAYWLPGWLFYNTTIYSINLDFVLPYATYRPLCKSGWVCKQR